MRIALQAALVAGAFAVAIGAATVNAALAGVGPAEQLVVVTAADWSAATGELRRFERHGARAWHRVGPVLPVSLGRAGLGRAAEWPAGDADGGDGRDGRAPDKREGDQRSPAGVFALGLVTGYDAAPPAGTRMPYRVATAALRCVDDARSPLYNRQVDLPDGGAAWASDEAMRRDDELYRLTVFVGHNAARAPGAGSCIFLHVWRAPDSPTVGCTAMALEPLRALIGWLDAARRPLLIQMPRAEYARLQRARGWPALDGGSDGKRK